MMNVLISEETHNNGYLTRDEKNAGLIFNIIIEATFY